VHLHTPNNRHLCAHSQHITELTTNASNARLDYIVSGAGSLVDASRQRAPHNNAAIFNYIFPPLNPNSTIGAFAYFAVHERQTDVKFINGKAQNLYNFTLFPRNL
jgi:hypothetical protein